MHVDYLIVGQGISGSFLSYFLHEEGRSFIVIDDLQPNSPSRIAAGLINPVTGRRMVKVWLADEVLPFARAAYSQMGNSVGTETLEETSILDFFPNPFMKENFLKREEEDNSYLKVPGADENLSGYFHFEFGYGEISPVFIANPGRLVAAWRRELASRQSLLEEKFDHSNLVFGTAHVKYGEIIAGKIIFCDGAAAAESNLFGRLPFASNKGEALVVSIPGLPSTNVYKKSILLVPLPGEGLFWAGSNYAWNFEDDKPTAAFRETTERQLKEWLKLPFKVEDHVAGVRPATLERRPFVGLHPHQPLAGILNGMGTKGCSLAPFFAKQLCDQLLKGSTILPEADIARFRKVLQPA